MTAPSLTVREPNGSRTHYTSAQVADIVNACRIELTLNFEESANVLSTYAAKLGISRGDFRQLFTNTD